MGTKGIKELREERGWTQYNLADESKVHQTTVSRIELGQGTGVVAALRIARVLKAPVETLFAHQLRVDDVKQEQKARKSKRSTARRVAKAA